VHTRRLSYVFLLCALPLGYWARSQQNRVDAIPMLRTVRIPVGAAGLLPVSAGATDELPEGPSGFDVLDDGSLLIADPLSTAIQLFDGQGKLRLTWNIGFSADSITVLPGGAVLVREANTGATHAFTREGKPLAGSPPAMPQLPTAQLAPEAGGTVAGIKVEFSRPGSVLRSLEAVAVDRRDTYVALEYSRPGGSDDAIDVDKIVRRYTPDGKLIVETTPLPLHYYFNPVDELRVHNGLIYQLGSTSSELQINIWDTNPR